RLVDAVGGGAVDGVALGLALNADDEDPAPPLVTDGGFSRRHGQANRSTTGLVLRSSLSRYWAAPSMCERQCFSAPAAFPAFTRLISFMYDRMARWKRSSVSLSSRCAILVRRWVATMSCSTAPWMAMVLLPQPSRISSWNR